MADKMRATKQPGGAVSVTASKGDGKIGKLRSVEIGLSDNGGFIVDVRHEPASTKEPYDFSALSKRYTFESWASASGFLEEKFGGGKKKAADK